MSLDTASKSVNLRKVGGTLISLGQALMAGSIPVVVSSNQSAVAADLAKVRGATVDLGQAPMAESVPVTIASDQPALGVLSGAVDDLGRFVVVMADAPRIRNLLEELLIELQMMNSKLTEFTG